MTGADGEPRLHRRPVGISIWRRIEWMDTDAAGIYHWTTAGRFAEAAEADLHRALEISDLTFGVSPRVSVSFEFERRLRFDDLVEVKLSVARLGRSSIAYDIELVGPEGTAATGKLVTCIVEPNTGSPVELGERLRQALGGGGERTDLSAGGLG